MLKRSIALGAAVVALAVPTRSMAQEAAPSASGSGSLSMSTNGGADADASGSWMQKYRPAPNLVELGVFAGVLLPSKNHNFMLRSHQFQKFDSAAPDFGIRAAYFPLSFLGAEVEGALMPTHTADSKSALLWAVRAHGIAQLPMYRITPFVLLGGGRMGAQSSSLGNDGDPLLEFGGGLKTALNKMLLLRLDVRDNLTQKHNATDGTLTHHPSVLLGLSVVLGRKSKPAAAPPPPPPPPVGDMDHDGFTDDKDKCPTQAGIAPDGCPPGDMDNDGFTDDKDKCPDIPGIAPNGCPPGDRDKDGFKDDQDKCPDEAGVAPDGCPIRDKDHDGIPDDKDKCPDKPETMNGFQDEDGCPDELPKAVKKFTGVVKGITFAFGKATIRPQSRPVLNAAVKVLKEYKDLRVKITGHTDNIGKHDDNVELSRKRAESVKAYMVEHGIDTDRIETQGMGPDEPIADNKTPGGRAKNRRIEFHLIHKAAPAVAGTTPSSTAPSGQDATPSGKDKK